MPVREPAGATMALVLSTTIDDACAAALDWRSGGDLGPLAGPGLMVVDLRELRSSVPRDEAVALLSDLPVVLVGVSGEDPLPAELVGVLDVVVADPAPPATGEPVGGAARSAAAAAAEGAPPEGWTPGGGRASALLGVEPGETVTAGPVTAALDRLATAVEASPAAAVALVQLLRAGERLPTAQAVLAESWVYSMLQAGSQHRAWLADRAPRRVHGQDRAPVRLERAGSELHVVLDRSEVRNAVDRSLRDGLCAALAVAEADPAVEQVHLWGEGPSFCAGGDLAEFGSSPDPATAHLVRSTRSPALALARLGSRLTVHVHGAAIGAGAEWSAFAGHVVACEDATFRLPELAMGLVPGAGGTASLPRRIGRRRAAWMALTGEAVDAATALAWGLVDEVVPVDGFGAPPA